MTRLKVGDVVALPALQSVQGLPLGAAPLTHLQFRRFAGCPICNLHLRSFERAGPRLHAAGVREIVIFHASAAELEPYVSALPFPVIADPDKRLYRRFGVEAGRRALLDPRVWPSILRAVADSVWQLLRRGQPAPSLTPTGGRWGLPADFLLTPDNRILALHYAEHANDQWSVEGLLALAGAANRSQPTAAQPET